jgi:hypothetical protein
MCNPSYEHVIAYSSPVKRYNFVHFTGFNRSNEIVFLTTFHIGRL